MKRLTTLRREAKAATSHRGHRMHWGEVYGRHAVPHLGQPRSKYMQTGVCKDCGMCVYLDEDPTPNGIDIGGKAVALNCPKLNPNYKETE